MAKSLIERIQWLLDQRERHKWYRARYQCLENEIRSGKRCG